MWLIFEVLKDELLTESLNSSLSLIASVTKGRGDGSRNKGQFYYKVLSLFSTLVKILRLSVTTTNLSNFW